VETSDAPRGFSRNAAGDVVVVMSEHDFQFLLMAIGIAAGSAGEDDRVLMRSFMKLANRLNVGNEHFRQYEMTD
jgi:hypothetical protein